MNIPIEERLIISLYDYTGNWPAFYIKNGYPVMLWDKQVEGDILALFGWLISEIEQTGRKPYGILSAPPCTCFAGSGARWWPEKDRPKTGYKPFESETELSIALVLIVLQLVDMFRDSLKFWVLENPVGRLEQLVPELKPYRKITFNPCEFGDPYTKKTILWGDFSENLMKTWVLPLDGSMVVKIAPGPNRKNLRSATPKGFARAFFYANQ